MDGVGKMRWMLIVGIGLLHSLLQAVEFAHRGGEEHDA
jgi:hypothetical protein